jgi:hypothetical protein
LIAINSRVSQLNRYYLWRHGIGHAGTVVIASPTSLDFNFFPSRPRQVLVAAEVEAIVCDS